MDNPKNQNEKLEYLKILLSKSVESASSVTHSWKGFFTFALIFFILSKFRTSELNLFGTKVDVPQEWILASAPIVLSFYFLRAMAAYEDLMDYQSEITDIVPEAIGGSEWKPSKSQTAAIRESLFWFKDADRTNVSSHGCLYDLAYSLIYLGSILALFIVPLAIIGYFIWLVWKSNLLITSIIVSVTSALLTIPGIILFFYQAKKEIKGA